ncbi:hypothetical protein ACLGI4_01170 [Streptomyces sp. HMX112]|uniref:hypothetical protein n=1 Tax=Streptomyces sp. HMX112 TaxID=3390850 RepID=UPI003A803770
MSESRVLAAELAQWLRRHGAFQRLTSVEVTGHLTSVVTAWGASHGWAARREAGAGITATARSGRTRTGLLDLLFHRPGGSRLAVEIDRGNKRWSLEKLIHQADTGGCAVWLRWDTKPCSVVIPPQVGLVELRVHQHRITDGRRRYSLA